MRFLLSFFLLSSSVQAAPLWICDGGQTEILWQPMEEAIELRLRKPESLARIRASLDEEVCVENAYAPQGAKVCVKKTLSDLARFEGDELIVENLQRWSFGSELQFLAGQYRPSLKQHDASWVLHLNNAIMVNSKTLIQWDNGPVTLNDCQPASPYPTARVQIQVLGDRYRDGLLISEPLPRVPVFAGNWQAGQILGETDESGTLTLDMELGSHHLSVMKLSSSHAAFWSDPQSIAVTQRHENKVRVHLAPVTVRLSTSVELPFGKALYLTGEGPYLGNWQQATRLHYRTDGRWELLKNLPIGAAYKLLLAEWTDHPTLWLNERPITWESGPNHLIPSLQNYYEVVINAEPRFGLD